MSSYIKSVRIVNCFGFQDSGEITFKKNGVYTLIGKNSSGKTSFLDALQFGIGIKDSSKFPRIENINSHDNKSYVEIDLFLDSQEMTSKYFLDMNMEIYYFPGEEKLTNPQQEYIDSLSKGLRELVFDFFRKNDTFKIKRNIENSSIESLKQLREKIDEYIINTLTISISSDGIPTYVSDLGVEVNKDQLVSALLDDVEWMLIPNISFYEQSLNDTLPDVLLPDKSYEYFSLAYRLIHFLGKKDLQNFILIKGKRERDVFSKRFEQKLDKLSKFLFEISGSLFEIVIDREESGIQLYFYVDGQLSSFKHLSLASSFIFSFGLRSIYDGVLRSSRINIIMDEPDKGLHPSVQKDLLRIFKVFARKGLVIFSTHSEYMIDEETMHSLLVCSKDTETKHIKVSQNLNWQRSKEGSHNTYLPLINAMGMKLSDSLIKKEKVVILEEMSALFYLRAFQTILDIENEISFYPSTGSGKVRKYIDFLISQGIDFKVLLDRQSKKVDRELKIDYPDLTLFLMKSVEDSKKSKTGIEDLFTNDDFDKFVHKKNSDILIPNSDFAKEQGLKKALTALTFYEKVKSGEIKKEDLDSKTLDAFREVLDFCINDDWYKLHIQ